MEVEEAVEVEEEVEDGMEVEVDTRNGGKQQKIGLLGAYVVAWPQSLFPSIESLNLN